MIVSSPAIEPTISFHSSASIAAHTAIAIPGAVLITRIFCAISIDTKPSLRTVKNLSLATGLSFVSVAYLVLLPSTETFDRLSSLISLETVACVTL